MGLAYVGSRYRLQAARNDRSSGELLGCLFFGQRRHRTLDWPRPLYLQTGRLPAFHTKRPLSSVRIADPDPKATDAIGGNSNGSFFA